MAKLKLTGKEIRAIGYPQGPVVSVAMQVMEKAYKHHSPEDALAVLKEILDEPANYAADETLGKIAAYLIPQEEKNGQEIALNEPGIIYNVFGAEHIDERAVLQMKTAARLPVAVAGALMPDAHAGYGLPIGGVLATKNAVIPYGVGVDIGCRMCLSIFDINPKELTDRESYFTRELNEATLFGAGREFDKIWSHEITDRPEFEQLPLLKSLQMRAAKQLGSSGSGNHFAEFGIIHIEEKDNILNVEPGVYTGCLHTAEAVRWAPILPTITPGWQKNCGSYLLKRRTWRG